ncbi:triple QxxK/R motif-containing protein isoform X2 [Rhineura floridana]|uniref:triple QxxK/R motif-containing protein isoform X2 n=1 Tax=Rhineura floridana TaxID=261503 RepID=UPI002AC7FECA|nr:triple QxxK/R motif-containing protein isoform X2 [Rhineura floridana]
MSKFQSIFLERLLLTLEGEADPSPPERGGRPSDIVNPPAAGGGEGGADTLRKQDYKKTRPMLKATRLKAEAKKTAPGIKDNEHTEVWFIHPTDVLHNHIDTRST